MSDTVRKAYGSVADLYISLFADRTGDVGFIGQHLGVVRGRVLDAGCGPGHLTAYLRALGVDAAGIDLVPEFIAYARKTHPEIDYRLGSMVSLDVADRSLGGILAWFSTIHLPPEDLDGVLHEFRRAVAPGGMLVAGFFAGDTVEPFDHRVVTAYRWPVDEFAGRLAEAGFAEVERMEWADEHTQRRLAAIAAQG